MKATRKIGLWKAIAFLTVVIFLVGCKNDSPTVETTSTYVGAAGTAIDVVGKVISDGGEAVYQRGFCLSRHSLPTVSDKKIEALNSKSVFSNTFSGLDQNTTYYVRAYAQNGVGVGYGEIIEVNTAALALAQTGDAEVLSNTAATLKATIDPLNSQAEVYFEVWRKGETLRRVEIQKTGTQSATEILAQATGLTPGEIYSYAVKVQNSYGLSTGETKTFKLPYEAVSDRDGNTYWTVKIGDQVWLAENLKTTKFANGDPIANVQPEAEWVALKTPAYCYYLNDPERGKVYGALYNNYVGLDARGLIDGYHVPTIEEYRTLVAYLGEDAIAAKKLKSNTSDWYQDGHGDNSSGFNALPGGCRGYQNKFGALKYQTNFQTVSLMAAVRAYYVFAVYYDDYPPLDYDGAADSYYGASIRLIKN